MGNYELKYLEKALEILSLDKVKGIIVGCIEHKLTKEELEKIINRLEGK